MYKTYSRHKLHKDIVSPTLLFRLPPLLNPLWSTSSFTINVTHDFICILKWSVTLVVDVLSLHLFQYWLGPLGFSKIHQTLIPRDTPQNPLWCSSTLQTHEPFTEPVRKHSPFHPPKIVLSGLSSSLHKIFPTWPAVLTITVQLEDRPIK